ncbi:hypothetical protein EJ03DRAFT_26451 [Teratosphaeria nubilosa]|uniref:PAN2-PAN3 deadenylation complex subunit PAN3 n=1 Tax=Teratosphaeria nubilosa TaxID=161662 RepID=A0A6G1KW49_9PEZI|nr:hypothetical protein EJ03DRAFT_26451 [Teratosphaeria nubilosa]
MAAGNRMSGDARRFPSSNHRFENQRPMSSQSCRNGPQCRKYQEGTCNYNHDFSGAFQANGLSKKSLNVDSPSFTPTFTPKMGNAQPVVKSLGLSPKAAAAASFTPRGSGAATPAGASHVKVPSGEFVPGQAFPPQQFQEFTPGQNFLPQPQLDTHQSALQSPLSAYNDPFLNQQAGISSLDGSHQQFNAFSQAGPTVAGQQFYQEAGGFKYPLNYHLSAAVGPRRDNMMAYQRASADFFISDDLREELHKKADAALQTFPNSTLPPQLEHFHSLVALDTNTQRTQSLFGYSTWIYKATSAKDGHQYALRRIEGFRLTSEHAITTFQPWKRVSNASVVHIHDAFTGKWFGDSSLIVVTDYHPLSQTLAEKHFAAGRSVRGGSLVVTENDLWTYIVQLASALQSIHEAGLAARTVTASKVLVTSKGRLRLGGCGVLDILRHDQGQSIAELQRSDLQDLGRLVLSIAARNQTAHQNTEKALQLVSRTYSDRFRACLSWLLSPPALAKDGEMSPPDEAAVSNYTVGGLLTNIADKIVAAFDSTLHADDSLTDNLMRELENGRLARLLMKINIILDRPDVSIEPHGNRNPALLNQPGTAWSETGERYPLQLFRDYVFHQVDHDGRPMMNLGHIVTSLNKLDAGIDEEVRLISRDEQTMLVSSYKILKRCFENAWADLNKASTARR